MSHYHTVSAQAHIHIQDLQREAEQRRLAAQTGQRYSLAQAFERLLWALMGPRHERMSDPAPVRALSAVVAPFSGC